MWLIAAVFAGLLLATFRLTSRYEYGPKSRRLLKLDLLASLVAGYVLAHLVFFPDATGVYLALASAALALVAFVFLALATAEVLRKNQQRVYDERLADLRRREQVLLAEFEATNRQMRAELRRDELAESATRREQREIEEHRQRVEAWKREGGAARIRSVKVEEWENELRALDPGALAARRAAAEEELAASPDPERRAHLEVLLSLCVMVSSGFRAVEPDAKTLRDSVAGAAERRRKVEEELSHVRAAIAEWERRLSEFLSKEIVLE